MMITSTQTVGRDVSKQTRVSYRSESRTDNSAPWQRDPKKGQRRQMKDAENRNRGDHALSGRQRQKKENAICKWTRKAGSERQCDESRAIGVSLALVPLLGLSHTHIHPHHIPWLRAFVTYPQRMKASREEKGPRAEWDRLCWMSTAWGSLTVCSLSRLAVYHYFVDIVTWNKDTRRGTFSVVLADDTGQKAESKVNP